MDEITKRLKELDEFEESKATETDYDSLLKEVKNQLKKARKELVDYRKNKSVVEDRQLEKRLEKKVEELGKKVEELKNQQREINEQKILVEK